MSLLREAFGLARFGADALVSVAFTVAALAMATRPAQDSSARVGPRSSERRTERRVWRARVGASRRE